MLPCLAILSRVEQYGDRRLRTWLIIATTLVCVPPAWTDFNPWLYQRLHIGWGVLLLTPAFYGLVLYFVLLVGLTGRAAAESREPSRSPRLAAAPPRPTPPARIG